MVAKAKEHIEAMSQQELLNRRARARLRWIEHYEQVTKKVAPTCRYFGITRTTFYRWYHRYMSLGVEGLKDRSSRPPRIQYHVPISRLRYKKRWRRYPQRYSKNMPGERLQIDAKFLENISDLGKRYYQFTVIDDCTRYRILRNYDHNTVKNAVDFVQEVRKALPFAIKQIQTDNGKEFSDQFSWYLEDLGIEHRRTKVRSPEENGKVERSHRTDEEEFYRTKKFVSIQHCIRLLRDWEREYNEQRPHMALRGKTPQEYLTEKLKITFQHKYFLGLPRL
jgi:transposase InsO family protein